MRAPLPLRSLAFYWRWRQLRRRGKTLRLRLGNLRGFFDTVNAAGIRYVVLRWFDEVPLSGSGESPHDIDFLVDAARLEEFCAIGLRFPGSVRCDIYTQNGRRATAFKKMPYYPPILAEEILDQRELFRDVFFVPSPRLHFLSLAFHAMYHKGPDSGIATGMELATEARPKRGYGETLARLAAEAGLEVPRPLTLPALHACLKANQWSMPHDLMVRWPVQHSWLLWLTRYEEDQVAIQARELPNVIVFLLRADAIEEPVRAEALRLLATRFEVWQTELLERGQIERLMRSVRGGNWWEHGKSVVVEPRAAVVVHDPAPKLLAADDPLRRKYPFVTNANVLFKNEVRDAVNARFPTRPKRLAIHGSDNALEAQHYLKALFGEGYAEAHQRLVARASLATAG